MKNVKMGPCVIFFFLFPDIKSLRSVLSYHIIINANITTHLQVHLFIEKKLIGVQMTSSSASTAVWREIINR